MTPKYHFAVYVLIFMIAQMTASFSSAFDFRDKHFEGHLKSVLRLTTCNDNLLPQRNWPIHTGQKFISNDPSINVRELGQGATAKVYRIREKGGPVVVEKVFKDKLHEDEYPGLKLLEIAQQETLVLLWLQRFFDQIGSEFQVAQVIAVNEKGFSGQPSITFNNIEGTNLRSILESKHWKADERKALYIKYVKELKKVYEALTGDFSKEVGELWAGVDDEWIVNSVAYGLPYLVVQIKGVQGSKLSDKTLKFGFDPSNILVSKDGRLILSDPL